MNQRKLAYDILKKVILQKQYANLLMQKALNSLTAEQRPFVTELVNGVLRHYALLKYNFTQKAKGKTKESDYVLLAMAAYERFFMKEKAYAVNNEYVKLADNRAFINAMLRSTDKLLVPEGEDPESLSIRYSLPEWLVRMWRTQYPQELQMLLEDAGRQSPVACRLNPRKARREDPLYADAQFFDAYGFMPSRNILDSEAFRNGAFYVQDRNAQQAVKYLDLQADSLFLDACSAPGGKLFNALESVDAHNAYANELHPSKAEQLKERLILLGYPEIRVTSRDARQLEEEYDFLFDRIMLDAPCSGLGVLKRKPDLRYNILPQDLDDLQKTQAEILEVLARMLKEEGILVYSTCTLNKKENEKQVASFLRRHLEFQLEAEHTFLHEEGDHFYLAKLRKRK